MSKPKGTTYKIKKRKGRPPQIIPPEIGQLQARVLSALDAALTRIETRCATKDFTVGDINVVAVIARALCTTERSMSKQASEMKLNEMTNEQLAELLPDATKIIKARAKADESKPAFVEAQELVEQPKDAE